MTFKVGKTYKTYGGWKALIIWEIYNCGDFEWEGNARYYVIHKPKEHNESAVIAHKKDGKAVTVLSVGEPPLYGKHYPADLKEELELINDIFKPEESRDSQVDGT